MALFARVVKARSFVVAEPACRPAAQRIPAQQSAARVAAQYRPAGGYEASQQTAAHRPS